MTDTIAHLLVLDPDTDNIDPEDYIPEYNTTATVVHLRPDLTCSNWYVSCTQDHPVLQDVFDRMDSTDPDVARRAADELEDIQSNGFVDHGVEHLYDNEWDALVKATDCGLITYVHDYGQEDSGLMDDLDRDVLPGIYAAHITQDGFSGSLQATLIPTDEDLVELISSMTVK